MSGPNPVEKLKVRLLGKLLPAGSLIAVVKLTPNERPIGNKVAGTNEAVNPFGST